MNRKFLTAWMVVMTVAVAASASYAAIEEVSNEPTQIPSTPSHMAAADGTIERLDLQPSNRELKFVRDDGGTVMLTLDPKQTSVFDDGVRYEMEDLREGARVRIAYQTKSDGQRLARTIEMLDSSSAAAGDTTVVLDDRERASSRETVVLDQRREEARASAFEGSIAALELDAPSPRVRLSSVDGRSMEFALQPESTSVFEDGERKELEDLEVGDRIRISYSSDRDRKIAQSIEIM